MQKLLDNIARAQMEMWWKDAELLLELDKQYYDFVLHFRKDHDTKLVKNTDEECEKFLKARERGEKYYPQLQTPECKYTQELIDNGLHLIKEFQELNCYLSKYYIELLYNMIWKMKFGMGLIKPQRYIAYQAQKPSMENYELALQCLRDNPYEVVDDSNRPIDYKEATKQIQDHIDKLGYKWKVINNDDMIPRMSVDIDKKMYVKVGATFSDTDIEGLKRHEVEGHIGRRYYGLKTGLYLFLMGLMWRNTLDEGLAIYNSLHKVKKVKPNVLFNIALKTIIAYNLDMDFCDLFEFCHKLAPNMELGKLFNTIIRFKREVQDCKIKGGNGDDQSYFCGYQIVKKMTDKERDDILKYNIGPDQLGDLDNIKLFLDVNKKFLKSLI